MFPTRANKPRNVCYYFFYDDLLTCKLSIVFYLQAKFNHLNQNFKFGSLVLRVLNVELSFPGFVLNMAGQYVLAHSFTRS